MENEEIIEKHFEAYLKDLVDKYRDEILELRKGL